MQPFLELNKNMSWYLQLADGEIAKTVRLSASLHLDLDEKGRVVGIEGWGRPKLPLTLQNALKMAGLAPAQLENA